MTSPNVAFESAKPVFPSDSRHPFANLGLTKREVFSLVMMSTLMRNGVYSEGEAVRYADLLIRALATTPIPDPTVPPVPPHA